MQEKYSLVPLATVKLCCRLKVSKLIFVWHRYILVENRWISQQWEWLPIAPTPQYAEKNVVQLRQKYFFPLVKSSNSSLIIFLAYIGFELKSKITFSLCSGASRMKAGQGICVLGQGILGHFRTLSEIFGAKGLFKDTIFEGRGCIPPPPLDAPLLEIRN